MTEHAPADPRPAPRPGLRLHLPDEAATRRLGAGLAEALAPGDAVLLSGPLGAGKSLLARAVIRARLADPEREVPSPSYTLVNLHEAGGEVLWHADLYRLAEPAEAAELGLEDALGRDIVLMEWPDRLGPATPPRHVAIALEPRGETVRIATVTISGDGWEALDRALAAWG